MKKIIYITLLASILFSCNNESESKMSIKKIDNKNSYSQAINKNAEEAQIKREYYENGQIKYEWNYVNGKKEGISKWYYNGQLQIEWNYVNGKKEGISKKYWNNGQSMYEWNYVNGKKEGICKEYDRNGQLKYEWNYVNGNEEGISKGYYNGQLMYVNGNKEGVSKEYFNGQLTDELIAIIQPNTNKDSLVKTIDSAIFSFFNEVPPPLNDEEKKKLEKEKHELYQKINDEQYNWGPNGFNEESWKQNYLFEYVQLGDAEDGRIFNDAVYWLFVRLAKVSFGKEREVYLKEIVNLSIRHADEAADYPDKLIALKELLRFQIHQKKPIKKHTLEDMSVFYLEMVHYIEDYIEFEGGEEIIYLRRLLDLHYSGELNKHIIFQEKASVSDTVFSNKVQFSAEEKNILSNLLSESSIVKLEQALYTLYNTDKDWKVIQSFIELAAIKDSLNLLDDDGDGFDDDYYGYGSLTSSLEKSDIGFNGPHYDFYQFGYIISFDKFSELASSTIGVADDEFFDFLFAHSDGTLYDNDKFGAWMAGAMFYRTWFLGEGAFLNYFKKETALVKKHKIYDEAFSDLSTEHIKDLKKIIENIHDDAIDYIFYDPRKEDDMGICCNKNEVIEELNQILAANVLSAKENKELKAHIKELRNDESEWKQWTLPDE